MNEKRITQIMSMYGLEPHRIFAVQRGYRSRSYPVLLKSGAYVNLIFYKQEAGIVQKIKNVHNITNFLANKGIAVRQPLNNRLICVKGRGFIQYGAIYNYLPGKTIPWEAYTQKHLKLLGQTLAIVHIQLREYDSAQLEKTSNVAYDHLSLCNRMSSYFTDIEVRGALQKKLRLSVNANMLRQSVVLLKACAKIHSQQALHMDFVRGNILFSESNADQKLSVSGILDFEKVAYGHPLFDVARTLAFLLVDCKYKSPDKIRKYFLDSGYTKHGGIGLYSPIVTLAQGKIPLLEALTDLFLLYDFYKFLLHNPYEFLEQNEHYIRTRDLLITRNVLYPKP